MNRSTPRLLSPPAALNTHTSRSPTCRHPHDEMYEQLRHFHETSPDGDGTRLPPTSTNLRPTTDDPEIPPIPPPPYTAQDPALAFAASRIPTTNSRVPTPNFYAYEDWAIPRRGNSFTSTTAPHHPPPPRNPSQPPLPNPDTQRRRQPRTRPIKPQHGPTGPNNSGATVSRAAAPLPGIGAFADPDAGARAGACGGQAEEL